MCLQVCRGHLLASPLRAALCAMVSSSPRDQRWEREDLHPNLLRKGPDFSFSHRSNVARSAALLSLRIRGYALYSTQHLVSTRPLLWYDHVKTPKRPTSSSYSGRKIDTRWSAHRPTIDKTAVFFFPFFSSLEEDKGSPNIYIARNWGCKKRNLQVARRG